MPGEVVITIKDKQWNCAVASTAAELTSGLSGVSSLPGGTGMLFVLPQTQIITITTQNMLFPLSVIFVGENLAVTEVIPLLAPGTFRASSLPCRYFVELNTGEADSIAPGDTVDIEIVAAAAPAAAADWLTPVITLTGVMMLGSFLTRMGQNLSRSMSNKETKKPLLYGPRGEVLMQTQDALVNPVAKVKGNDLGRTKLAAQRRPAVIPLKTPPKSKTETGNLEFLPDSPEFLAYTIDDIGYREKIDTAFLQAIARAKKEGGE
jgi:uncharacterized membrane protein (UPF0127 family)